MSDQIYYLRQSVKRDARLSSFFPNAQEHELIVHYYVKTEDSSNAGGAAGAFCIEHGLECIEYICLPQPISRDQIAAYENEHLAAYELAQSKGFAVVVATVLT